MELQGKKPERPESAEANKSNAKKPERQCRPKIVKHFCHKTGNFLHKPIHCRTVTANGLTEGSDLLGTYSLTLRAWMASSNRAKVTGLLSASHLQPGPLVTLIPFRLPKNPKFSGGNAG